MAYEVTARKYRPLTLEDMVGQEHVTGTLRNAFLQKRLAHAYLFSGQRGCGKTTSARILARMVNCLSPKENGDPCNTCEICQDALRGASIDLIEIDGASNRGVEEIRRLRDSVRFTPSRGKYKTYIIDEVHMLTKEAFNALLKTLEEPPPHALFVLATTEVYKLPATILSRCQRFDFRRLTVDEIAARLGYIAGQEKIEAEKEALQIVARKGDGSMRDAQSIFDQVRAFCGSPITAVEVRKALNVVNEDVFFRVTELVRSKDLAGGIALVDEVVRQGHDLKEFVVGLAEHLRNLLVTHGAGNSLLVEASDVYRKKYEEETKSTPVDDVLRLLRMTHELEQSLRWTAQPRYRVEAAILQMIRMESTVSISSLLEQIEQLKGSGGATKPAEDQGAGRSARSLQPDPAPRDTSQMRVMGTVNASDLRQKLNIRPTPEERRTMTPLPAIMKERLRELPTVETPMTDFSGSWKALEEGFRAANNAMLFSVCSGVRPSEVRNGVLKIACPDSFHEITIKRHKAEIAGAWLNTTGQRVRIDTEVDPWISKKIAEEKGAESPPISQEELEKHPIIQALKREFDARLIQ